MLEGWFKTYRKIREWQHFQEPTVVLVWLDLLISANSKDGWYHGQRLRRGEFFTSVAAIQEHTGLDAKTVRRALDKLVATGEIEREATNAGSKITINQFIKYQGSGNNPQPNPQQVPQQPPQPNPQRIPYQQEYIEREEGKKEENIFTHTLRAGEKIGIFENVNLSDSDLEKIRMNFATEGLGDEFILRCIDKLSTFMANGHHYDNHAAAILHWVKTAVLEEDRRTGKTKQPTHSSNPTEAELLEKSLRRAWDNATEQERQDYLNKYHCYPWENNN